MGGLLPAPLEESAGGFGQAALAGLRHGPGADLAGRLADAAGRPVVGAVSDNDPDGAQARMRELYGLVRLRFGQPADPARAASLEIDWWRAHRRRQYASHPAETGDELAESVTRLYCYLFGETEAVVRPAAVHRVRAMDLSDQWVREGCQPDSPLLPLERAALVRAYAALLAAVHHEER